MKYLILDTFIVPTHSRYRIDLEIIQGPLSAFCSRREAPDNLARALERMANRGWELVTICSIAGGGFAAIFRQKSDEGEVRYQRGEVREMYCGDCGAKRDHVFCQLPVVKRVVWKCLGCEKETEI